MTIPIDEVIQILKNDIELSKMNVLFCHNNEYGIGALQMAIEILEQTRWIPVKWHIKTEVEEYEQYPEGAVMLDCPMPEDEEDVLITIKGKNGQVWVEKDIALKDEDGWYTDGGYDWVDDVIAWMPLPEPFQEIKHTCSECIIKDTDACSRGNVEADEVACEDFVGGESE